MVADKSTETYTRLGSLDGVATKLKADLNKGLRTVDVQRQQLVYGENRMPEQEVKSFLQHLLEALNDLTLMILAVAATITIIFGVAVTNNSSDWIQGISIMLAVIIVSGVTSVVNYWQDGEFQSLSATKEDRLVTVMRDDKEQQISIFEVVVGDMLKVNGGDVIPCDGVMIRGHGISVTEAQINGESRPAKITDKSPFLIGGAEINDGSGWMLVCAVGEESTYGQIVASLQGAEQEDTPLQEKLDVLASQIGYVGLAFGGATFIVLFIRLFAEGKDDSEWYVDVVGYLVIGITIVVVAVPEGLPLAVTISLAWSMQAMTRDMSLVRELAACETMGSATAICSDKTGTLTLNQMTVVAGYFFGRLHLNGAPKEAEIGDGHTGNLAALVRGIAWNATGAINYADGQPPQMIGNRTECALLHMLHRDLEVDFEQERRSAEQRLFYRENFSSDRKRMSSVYVVCKGDEDGEQFLKELAKDGESDAAAAAEEGGEDGAASGGGAAAAAGEGDAPEDIEHTKSTIPHPKPTHRMPSTGHIAYPTEEVAGYRLVCKGASEILLDLCQTYRQQNGEEAPITDEMRSTLKEHILKLARRGLRTLVVAERRLSPADAPCASDVSQEERDDAYHANMAELEKEMTLLCIAGIQDPLRKEVPAAVRVCKQAGIRVRMVTGDNIETAMQIARSCGIMTDEYNVAVTGTQYRTMSDEERVAALPKLAVMARSLPTDKLLMVRDLKNRMNEVVAVTGDGTNDAPALKEAHVGLSMGITGTEVAKEASKIIILDDNFASIVATVKWGRSVFKNISSFLAFQLAINVSALTITFIIACTNDGSTQSFPITPTQLIYVNLIMDSLGALMLATSPPEERMMLQEPNSHEKPLLTKILIKMVMAHGVWETIVVLVLALTEFGKDVLLVPEEFAVGSREHNTSVFNVFIFLVIWNKLHAAKIHDELDNIFTELMENMLALGILIGILVLQILIIEVGGEDVFQTVPQKWDQWLVAIAIGFTSVPLGYLVKFIPYYDEYDVLAKTYGFWAPPGAAEKADAELEKNRVQRGAAGEIASFADETGGAGSSAVAASATGAHIELPETPKQTDGVGSGATGGTA